MEKPNNEYFITYSNHLFFANKTLAFRNKLLFDITNVPTLINFNEKNKYWLVNRHQLTKSKAKEIYINEPKIVDVTGLQWNIQINLDKCFNL